MNAWLLKIVNCRPVGTLKERRSEQERQEERRKEGGDKRKLWDKRKVRKEGGLNMEEIVKESKKEEIVRSLSFDILYNIHSMK